MPRKTLRTENSVGRLGVGRRNTCSGQASRGISIVRWRRLNLVRYGSRAEETSH